MKQHNFRQIANIGSIVCRAQLLAASVAMKGKLYWNVALIPAQMVNIRISMGSVYLVHLSRGMIQSHRDADQTYAKKTRLFQWMGPVTNEKLHRLCRRLLLYLKNSSRRLWKRLG
jgi:hypothetical protein